MNKYLLKFGLVFLLVIGVLLGLNLNERKKDRSRGSVMSVVFAKKENVDCAVFGSSYLMRAIHTAKSRHRIVNFSLSGSAYNVDVELARWYLENHQPKLIIMDASILYHLNLNSPDWSSYFRIDNHYNPNFFISIAKLNRIKLPLIRALYSGMKKGEGEPKNVFDSTGYPIVNIRDDFKDAKYSSTKIKKSNYTNYVLKYHQGFTLENNKFNANLMQEFITFCDKKKVKVIFVSPPKHKVYNSSFDHSVYDLRDSFFSSIKNETLFNYEKLWENDSSKFLDIHHLNLNGGNQFTLMIDDLIESLI